MKTCLVVDDSEVIQKVAGALLSSMKFIVSHAETIDEARDVCKRDMPDIILQDWHMLGAKPLQFIQELKATYPNNCGHIIYCTTDADPDVIGDGFDAGADDYLLKPFDKTSLRAKLTAKPLAA
jgi:two-component system, chemotaxis family, chemotaxis protein CheY